MAVKSTVNRFAQRLGSAVRRYAIDRGIDANHLALAGIYDKRAGRVYLDVGVDLPIDERQWWLGIREEVGREFGGEPPSSPEYGLVMHQVGDLESFLDRLIIDDDTDLDLTDLLNAHG